MAVGTIFYPRVKGIKTEKHQSESNVLSRKKDLLWMQLFRLIFCIYSTVTVIGAHTGCSLALFHTMSSSCLPPLTPVGFTHP